MKSLWRQIGIIAFWLSWPLLWLVLNNTERTRLILVKDDKLLVVRGWLSDGRWSLPGGGIHKHETPEDSLVREIKEELGFTIDPQSLQPMSKEKISQRGFMTLIHFFMSSASKAPVFKPKPLEINEYAWLKAPEINEKNADTDVKRGLTLSGLLK